MANLTPSRPALEAPAKQSLRRPACPQRPQPAGYTNRVLRIAPRQWVGQPAWLKLVVTMTLVSLSPSLAANDAPPPQLPDDLAEASLEQLIQIKVTSVAKKKQDISKAAAAIYVITQEDIRRSGATSIPEALRMVPGLQVAQIDANKWAVGSRGFNGRFANKLVVLIDGRTVYNPLFSGVYWDMQDLLLEDIERIEVIQGPGATIWGANAVNGVINVITKPAADTQGAVITTGGGNQDGGFGSLRYGGRGGPNVHYRLYQRYFHRNAMRSPLVQRAQDEWDTLRGGFRLDWEMNQRDSLTIHGSMFNNGAGQTALVPTLMAPFSVDLEGDIDSSGGSALGLWQRRLSDNSDLSLQVYFDRTERREQFLFREDRNTYDAEFQHRFRLSDRNELLWGLGYRATSDRIEGSRQFSYFPESRTTHFVSGFVQDELQLLPDKLYLTVGSKFERNGFRGYPIQPSVRVLWNPKPKHSVWGAVSRAVRTPSRTEQDLRADILTISGPLGAPMVFRITGTPEFQSETLLAYELGYRVRASRQVSVDVAAFYNVYDSLRTGESGVPFVETVPRPTHLVVPVLLENQSEGEIYGGEISAKWRPARWWQLGAGYSWLEIQFRRDPTSVDESIEQYEEVSPTNQLSLSSFIDLPGKWNWDTMVYYVDSVRGSRPFANTIIPSYTRVDTRLGWLPNDRMEFSIGLQNLLDPRHLESEPETFSVPSEIGRSVVGRVSWRF